MIKISNQKFSRKLQSEFRDDFRLQFRVKPTLMHLRNLISKYEDKWVDSRTFTNHIKR